MIYPSDVNRPEVIRVRLWIDAFLVENIARGSDVVLLHVQSSPLCGFSEKELRWIAQCYEDWNWWVDIENRPHADSRLYKVRETFLKFRRNVG